MEIFIVVFFVFKGSVDFGLEVIFFDKSLKVLFNVEDKVRVWVLVVDFFRVIVFVRLGGEVEFIGERDVSG